MNPELSFPKLVKRVDEFQSRVFPHQSFDSKAEHLGREVMEWRKAPQLIMECADVFLLTLGCACKQGFTVEQLLSAAHEKMDINNLRRWSHPDEQGVHHHIEEAKS
jgi:hypothetical protein